MEKPSDAIDSLFEKTADYLETRVDLLKLQAVDRSTELTGTVVSGLVLVLVISFFIFMLNIGVALWIGAILGKYYFGFFIVAGFYGVLGLVLYLFRHQWLKEPVSNLVIKKLLN